MCYQKNETVLLLAERFFFFSKSDFFIIYINFTDGKAVNMNNPQGSFMCKVHKAWMLCQWLVLLVSPDRAKRLYSSA
jgi:hypothetical protein